MGNAHGSHDTGICIEERCLASFELAHSLWGLDHLVKLARLARIHSNLVCFKTDKFALSVFFRLKIPDKIVAASLNKLTAFAHKAAKSLVHLDV